MKGTGIGRERGMNRDDDKLTARQMDRPTDAYIHTRISQWTHKFMRARSTKIWYVHVVKRERLLDT